MVAATGLMEIIEVEGYEGAWFGSDPTTGLRCVIAIHSTLLGPSLGGARFFPYRSDAEALRDAKRLAQGMTLKAAVAGVELGGGKAVIIGDPATDKSEDLLRSFGRFVDGLGGRYITAEDIGTTIEDMTIVRQETEWVAGLPVEMGSSGDPSPRTARGLLASMRAVSQYLWATDSLAGRKVAVQGIGKVGSSVVTGLVAEGCEVAIGDVSDESLARVVARHEVGVVPPDEILFTPCDIVAPCSVGGVLNEDSIPRLDCAVVAGAANNQLESDEDAQRLAERGILYAPDFVVNAGGLINIADEFGGYSADRATTSVDRLYDTTLEVLSLAERYGVLPNEAAISIAEARISAAAR